MMRKQAGARDLLSALKERNIDTSPAEDVQLSWVPLANLVTCSA